MTKRPAKRSAKSRNPLTAARTDSVWSRLTPDQRDELFQGLLDGIGLTGGQKLLDAWGFKVSLQTVSKLMYAHGLEWRMAKAREAAAAVGVDEADLDDQRKKALALQRHQAVFDQLSVKEMVALAKLEIEETKVAALHKQIEQADRKLQLLEAREAKMRQIVDDPGTDHAGKIALLEKALEGRYQ
jgi:hypothetical protein